MKRLALICLCLMGSIPAWAIDWSKHLPHAHKSRFFEFHYQREGWDVAGFARFADGFIDLINRDFIPVKFDYPITVLVLPDRPSFQQYLKRELAVSDPPNFGIYFNAFKFFATYEGSGYGTFAHEIMHPLVDRNLGDRPYWAAEGIPAFFEKFLGYWDGDAMRSQWGYQNPWRIEAMAGKLIGLDLGKVIADRRPRTAFDNSERRLVAVFLWQHGKFRRFLELIAARDRRGFDSYFEAAMEKPLKDIIPLWKTYLEEAEAHRSAIMRVPVSTVLPDRAAYEKLLNDSPPWLPQHAEP